MDRGLLTLTTSIYPVLRMIPALILSEADVEEMLSTMREAVKEVARQVEGKGEPEQTGEVVGAAHGGAEGD